MGRRERRQMTVLFPLLVALVGVLAYALSNNVRVCELGRIAYAMGLLAFLLTAGPHIVSFLGR